MPHRPVRERILLLERLSSPDRGNVLNYDDNGLSQEDRPVRNYSMIRKLKSGKYRLYSQKKNPKTGKRRNLGTFDTREAAEKHERAVQYFKRQG
jgi:hypothetical protein